MVCDRKEEEVPFVVSDSVPSSEEDHFIADPVGHCCACAVVVVARDVPINSVMIDNTAAFIVVIYMSDHGGFCPLL